MQVAMADHRRRAREAWTAKDPYVANYRDTCRWAAPYRRPANQAPGDNRAEHIFDATAINSTLRGAGRLQEDMFPPGRRFFRLTPGPLARAVADAEKEARGIGDNGGPPLDDDPLDTLQRQLDRISSQIWPFFINGEWDNSVSEMCIDLFIGTGLLLILRGPSREQPLRFVSVPFEEVAFEAGPYGDVGGVFWRTRMSRRAIKAAFPDGKFDADFEDELGKNGSAEIEINQDIVQAPGGGWHFVVWLQSTDETTAPISTAKTRTCPFAAPRYYRVPGEVYGRGPPMLTLPSIKALNKAMELTLKAAAINMLGVWGYRPGGTFNPNQIQLKPGAFWPMGSTGGSFGADVARLDPATGRMEISVELMTELRTQIQQALHDEQLPEGGLTPKSAAEVMARMARVKANYVGAFGRMIHEVIPPVVARVIEILHGWNLLVTPIEIDKLFISLEVQSPLAQALKADSHQTTVQAIQLVAALLGSPGVQRLFKLDELLPVMVKDLGVDSQLVRTVKELAEWDQAAAQAASGAQLTEAVLNKPGEFAGVVDQAMGGGDAGNVVPMPQRGAA